MDRDGSNKLQLSPGTDPKWSPDGSRILYKVFRSDGACCDIFVMDADGANQTKLAEQGGFHRWLPDGSKIVYFSSISGSYQIYRMDPDGSHKQQLTH
jgi:TolB protein